MTGSCFKVSERMLFRGAAGPEYPPIVQPDPQPQLRASPEGLIKNNFINDLAPGFTIEGILDFFACISKLVAERR
jgi:hypothetical protein